MMRAAARSSLRQLDSLRERWELMDRTGIPHFDELDRIVTSDALLGPATEPAARAAQHRTPPLAGLDLLPSRFGPGCRTSIAGYWGAKPPADWPGEDDTTLRGIAIMPEGNALWEQAWLREAVQRLREGSTLLLSTGEARAYLAGNEAAYWVWRAGGTSCWPRVRWPALWQRLLWRVLPPNLPRDRELAAQLRAVGRTAAGGCGQEGAGSGRDIPRTVDKGGDEPVDGTAPT